jgi:transposase InsO family protein
MNDEFSDRHRAIQLRLAGQSVAQVCQALHRSPRWFHKWWMRYLEFGPDGLFDFSHTAHQVARRMPPELERTIVTIRRRLEARLHPGARYHLIGASAILAELQALHIRPLPSERTIERVLQQLGLTQPCVRLARWISRHDYPTPLAHTSNDLHQIDLVGPLYLKGKRQRYYILVCKDVFDGAVCLKLSRSRKMDAFLAFLGDCWKTLGRPAQVQFDNARELVGWGPAARYLSRVIRLCLRFGVEPIFIPPRRPQYQGSVENFNSWFQPQLLQRRYTQPGQLKRELQRLQDTVNTQHVHRRLGGLTPAQYRRRLKLQLLPAHFMIPTELLPIAAGRVTFIRLVTAYGQIHLLSQTFWIGKRLKGQYVKAVLDTTHGYLTVYVQGRIFKRWPYRFLTK